MSRRSLVVLSAASFSISGFDVLISFLSMINFVRAALICESVTRDGPDGVDFVKSYPPLRSQYRPLRALRRHQ